MEVEKRESCMFCTICHEVKIDIVKMKNKNNKVICWICKECLEEALTLINKEIENA